MNCHVCGKYLYKDGNFLCPTISISQEEWEGSAFFTKAIHFHPDCFEKIAGKEYIPTKKSSIGCDGCYRFEKRIEELMELRKIERRERKKDGVFALVIVAFVSFSHILLGLLGAYG